MRPGGGVDLADHALPNVPGRVDPSRADRHPISTDRERADSRSRRARGLPDRSYSPPGRARGGPRARERGDVSVSPNRDVGRNRSPRPAAVPYHLRPGIGNQGGRGRSAIAGASLRTWIDQSAIAGTSLRTQTVIQEVVGVVGPMPTSRVPAMSGGPSADAQSPGR